MKPAFKWNIINIESMWIAGMRRGTPRWGDTVRQQDSGVFFLEHPYRSHVPNIHEMVLAWLLGDDDCEQLPPNWRRPAPRPA